MSSRWWQLPIFHHNKQSKVNDATPFWNCSVTNSKITCSVVHTYIYIYIIYVCVCVCVCVCVYWISDCFLDVHWLLPFTLSNHMSYKRMWRLCAYLLQLTEGMANRHAKPKAKHPEDSVEALTQPVNPNSAGLQQNVKLVVQCFRSAWLSESDLDNLWQGQTKRQSSVSAQKWSAVTLQQLNLWKTWLYWVQLTFSSQQWQEVKKKNHSDHKGAVPVGVLHATVS